MADISILGVIVGMSHVRGRNTDFPTAMVAIPSESHDWKNNRSAFSVDVNLDAIDCAGNPPSLSEMG